MNKMNNSSVILYQGVFESSSELPLSISGIKNTKVNAREMLLSRAGPPVSGPITTFIVVKEAIKIKGLSCLDAIYSVTL
jgi:hypothetical protein